MNPSDQPVQVTFKRFDTSLPVPAYATPGAAGIDLVARETHTIPPRKVVLIPLNIALQIPKNHWVLLAARSSLHKKGVSMANGIGVGDSDYCGDGDEYRAALLNYTDQSVTIERGERIVQMIILPFEKVNLTEVETFGTKDRGGFGSTGK